MQSRNAIRSAGAALLLAGQLFAGGFYLEAGNPEANAEARKAKAALTVKAAGCHDPASAKVSATAVGIVNGERKAIPLKVTPLSEPGMFAVAQQWPKEGRWVIQLAGQSDGAVTTTLVAAGPNGVDTYAAISEMREFTPAEVEAILRK